MGHRLRHVALVLLGAVLLGTVGLALGSWYGGRGAAPLSSDQAQSMAEQLLPGTEQPASTFARGNRYGTFLASDDFGSAYAEFHYRDSVDCAHSESLRRSAESLGWQGSDRVPGTRCDGWRAERDGMTATLTHETYGALLRIAPTAPDGLVAATLAATAVGAALGGALFWLAGRQRRPVPGLVGTLGTIVLLPGAALTWQDLLANGLAEPVWPIWRSFAPLPLSLVLLLVAVIAYVKMRARTAPSAAVSAAAHAPGARASELPRQDA
ncbi:hypothetical protein [Micromonospora parathelypteridis]|uniref:Uncharacterized protein n=1 Tax=Micromonospora parathelypteridis TaxID=1839617 RepID=A0A840VJP8_9ACTN|nr:hypothetical protein [Micromonospora parathelypteridis]MBB5476885.1 hypothetical protein [Micromonospora parathelypteridis]GGO17503.1 hypothetical protein GCM10011576_31470 [Micromonospora parathelypteridis]